MRFGMNKSQNCGKVSQPIASQSVVSTSCFMGVRRQRDRGRNETETEKDIERQRQTDR